MKRKQQYANRILKIKQYNVAAADDDDVGIINITLPSSIMHTSCFFMLLSYTKLTYYINLQQIYSFKDFAAFVKLIL